jgi:trans-2,3-dihydro-3-hydroxyanthranilate isomerase
LKNSLPYYLYDAFAKKQFGGSQAAIVLEAAKLDNTTRIRIAKEMGYPATVFVSELNDNDISAQFYSTVAELPMCGHGTVALISCLSNLDLLNRADDGTVDVTLKLAAADAKVKVSVSDAGKTLAMLEVKVAEFRNDSIDPERLCHALGISDGTIDEHYPIETAVGDFVHLMVPIKRIGGMKSLEPNFGEIVSFHADFGIETITVLCADTGSDVITVRVRDFCPAVGVAESAAAGTTNAAVAGYLFRHDLLPDMSDEEINIVAAQGIEIERPSEIHSRLIVQNNKIVSQWVGGVASHVASGYLHVD